MDLLAMESAKRRGEVNLTVLQRPGGVWHETEVAKLVNRLKTEASQHSKHPEYVILLGAYTKAQTLRALEGGTAYTATAVVGLDAPALPFAPSFI